MPEQTTTLRVPIGVWISIVSVVLVMLAQLAWAASTFGSFQTKMDAYGMAIQTLSNSNTNDRINQIAVDLATVKEQAAANKDEIRSIRWQLNRVPGVIAPKVNP